MTTYSRIIDAIDKSNFPAALNQANITPVIKTKERYSKDNYSLISILPNASKIFQKCMFREMSHYMKNLCPKRSQKRIQSTILPFKNA